ncbi:MAG: toprim domain-containing protein [Malacoplasma sp.]
MKIKEFEYLVDVLKSLPSISTKIAERIAYFLINSDDEFYNKFIERIVDSRMKIKLCKYCKNFTSDNFICDICSNVERRNHNLCIVSSVEDLYKIENLNIFFGTYYVLHGEINYKKNETINYINFDNIFSLIEEFGIKEILMATNMTMNGDITATYIKKMICEKINGISIYRLAIGLPMNSSIEYVDWESLTFSIKNKIKM